MLSFPRSELDVDTYLSKFQYLRQIKGPCASIQEQVRTSVIPFNGFDSRMMLATEVPQSLFVSVMGLNTSRNSGDDLPVDAVNFNEAREFCQKLSWIMGDAVTSAIQY